MGSDSAKTHEAFTVAPAAPARPSHAVDVRDDRPAGSTPLHLDADALDTALAAVGVTVGPHTLVKVRLRPQQFPDQQGSTRRIGPDAYRVVVHVADKPTFKDRHLYVVNNSLLHELRHVAQMQHDPDHASHYANENLTVGYEKNKYEVEARYYGRLADHTGMKDTGLPGRSLGKKAWALHSSCHGKVQSPIARPPIPVVDAEVAVTSQPSGKNPAGRAKGDSASLLEPGTAMLSPVQP